MLAAEFAREWRKQSKDLAGLKIYQCPMAKTAVPSAETNMGRWLQLTGPLRNPFFGSEMLDCGEEVKP
jgi:Cu(I)/Ag(I) efflux system membrane fusion protein